MEPITLALALAGQFAPSIIKYFTNSDTAGAVAAQVIDVAKSVTGKGQGEEALEALKLDPALALQFKTAVLDREADLEKAYLQDRQDARKRDVELARAGLRNKRADIMVALAAFGTAGGLLGMLALGYLKAKFPEAISEGVFGALLAQLSTITSFFGLCLRDAFQFEFGSSRGSRDKDALISRGN